MLDVFPPIGSRDDAEERVITGRKVRFEIGLGAWRKRRHPGHRRDGRLDLLRIPDRNLEVVHGLSGRKLHQHDVVRFGARILDLDRVPPRRQRRA